MRSEKCIVNIRRVDDNPDFRVEVENASGLLLVVLLRDVSQSVVKSSRGGFDGDGWVPVVEVSGLCNWIAHGCDALLLCGQNPMEK